jgi:hypothetical protein
MELGYAKRGGRDKKWRGDKQRKREVDKGQSDGEERRKK